MMLPFFEEVNDEVARFFRGLGYYVTWDANRREKTQWYEIEDERGLIVQIDMGPSLEAIRRDLTCLHLGIPPDSDAADYVIAGPPSDRLNRLCKTVTEVNGL